MKKDFFDALEEVYTQGDIGYAYVPILRIGEARDTTRAGGDRRITGNTMQFCIQFGKGQDDKVRKAYETFLDGSEIITAFGGAFLCKTHN